MQAAEGVYSFIECNAKFTNTLALCDTHDRQTQIHVYRLDPHVDPAADGETVVIMGVDAGTVLTLCPPPHTYTYNTHTG